MLADERLQTLCQADEADGQGAVPQHLTHLVIGAELIGIQPYALSHQEGIVAHLLGSLDLEALQQLLDDQIHLALQFLKEPRPHCHGH